MTLLSVVLALALTAALAACGSDEPSGVTGPDRTASTPTETPHKYQDEARKAPPCDAKYIRAGLLDGVVWEMVSEAIRHPEILSQEVQRHVQTGDGDLGERMTKLRREIADLKSQQRRLIELRQKDIIDQDILEGQISPVRLLCDEKARQFSTLEEQQKQKDAAVDVEERIAEYFGRVAEGLDNLDQEGNVRSLRCQGRSYARRLGCNFGDRLGCNDNSTIVLATGCSILFPGATFYSSSANNTTLERACKT